MVKREKPHKANQPLQGHNLVYIHTAISLTAMLFSSGGKVEEEGGGKGNLFCQMKQHDGKSVMPYCVMC